MHDNNLPQGHNVTNTTMEITEILYSVITKMALKKSIKKLPLAIWSFVSGKKTRPKTQEQERVFLLNLCNAKAENGTISFTNHSLTRDAQDGICLYMATNQPMGTFWPYQVMVSHESCLREAVVNYSATYRIRLLREELIGQKHISQGQAILLGAPYYPNLREVAANLYQSFVAVNNEAKQTDQHLKTIEIQHIATNCALPTLHIKTEYDDKLNSDRLFLEIRLLKITIAV